MCVSRVTAARLTTLGTSQGRTSTQLTERLGTLYKVSTPTLMRAAPERTSLLCHTQLCLSIEKEHFNCGRMKVSSQTPASFQKTSLALFLPHQQHQG